MHYSINLSEVYILNYGTKADYITFYVPQRINIPRQTWNAIRNEFYAWSKPSERTFVQVSFFIIPFASEIVSILFPVSEEISYNYVT